MKTTNNDIKNIITDICNNIIIDIYKRHDVYCNQKYGDKPYSYHLRTVVENACIYICCNNATSAISFNDMMILKVSAAAHDAIEDARLTYNDLIAMIESHYINKSILDKDFSHKVADIVYAVTDEKGKNRKERHSEKYWEGIINTPGAAFIKCCDRLSNLQESLKDSSKMSIVYKKEYEEFINNIKKSVDYKNDMLDCILEDMNNLLNKQ